jgi:hypothetical protein
LAAWMRPMRPAPSTAIASIESPGKSANNCAREEGP